MYKLYKLDMCMHEQNDSFATIPMRIANQYLSRYCEGNQYLHEITLSICGEDNKKFIMSKTFTNEPKKFQAIDKSKSNRKH